MNSRTLYVTDLDGTLLGMAHELTCETIAILKGLKEKNVDLVIATARNYASAKRLLEPIDFQGDLILLNGALISDTHGNTQWAQAMDPSLAQRIYRLLQAWRHHVVFSSITDNNHIELPEWPADLVSKFVDYRRCEGFSGFRDWTGEEALFAQQLLTMTYMLDQKDASTCMALLAENGVLGELNAHAMPYPGIEGLITLTIQPASANKGTGLEQLLRIRSESQEVSETQGASEVLKVVAFGDQLNDLELFATADEGYAVLEAHPNLVAIATGVIGSHRDSAVARWIAKDCETKARIDERDIMFARMRYAEGSEAHSDYYSRHPEKRALDDQIKLMPHLFGPQTATFHPYLSSFGDAGFEVISGLKQQAESLQGPRGEKLPIDARAMAKQIVDFAKQLGCDDVAIVALEAEDLYSYKGRENYGRPIENTLVNGLVLVKAMDKNAINRAPQLEASFTVVKAYLELATVGLWLAKYIEHLGYSAIAHIDGSYEGFLPAIAEKAGLGEIGRANLLIHPEFGMSLRLAMVSTDLPLITEKLEEKPLQIRDFCSVCMRCATTCPGKAISSENLVYSEALKGAAWPFNQESCYAVWRRLGTDCGVCLSSCPWTQGLTVEENEILKHSGVKAAFDAYQQRQPLRKYIREPLSWINYPLPPREI